MIEVEDYDKYLLPPPSDTTHYTIMEVILHIQNSTLTVNQFHTRRINRKTHIVLYSLATLYRHYNLNKSQGVGPAHGNDSINEGRPKLIAKNELKNLNEPLGKIGYVEGVVGLQETMMSIINKRAE